MNLARSSLFRELISKRGWRTSAALNTAVKTETIDARSWKQRDEDVEKNHRPFDEIPGPKSWPLVGNALRFVPYIGTFGQRNLLEQLRFMRDSYGTMVRLVDLPNQRPTIFLFSPDLCEKMYRLQGTWPQRIAMESFQMYREKRAHIFGGLYGLTVSQGEKWHEFRSKVNQHMMHPRAIKPHVSQINDVTEELVSNMRSLRDPSSKELPREFNNELKKWALEAIGSIALDHRLGCLKPDLKRDSDPQMMIDGVDEMFFLMYKLEIMPSMWKIYETRNLKKLFHLLDKMNAISMKYINRATDALEDKSMGSENETADGSVLEKLLRVDKKTALIMALDMLLAGVDTTGNASAALLYYLANNPEKQQKLRDEALTILPSRDEAVTSDSINNIPYTRACIKEALRMFPISIGNLRTMQQDITLGGYVVPEGSNVIACHALLSRDPAEFPEPDKFIPERWLREQTSFPRAKDAHHFAYMPFGFGARSCIGKRFAEMEMEVLALKVVRNFRLEWHHGPLDFKSHMINTVSTPLELKLTDLS